MQRTARVFVLAGLLGFGASVAHAKGLPHFGMSVYSNFCVSPMSDDLYGARITLRRSANGANLLVYEYSDGSDHALIAKALVLDEKTGAVRFEVDDTDGSKGSVSGQFSPDGATLKLRGMLFDDPGHVSTLARVTDFTKPVAKCKPTRG